MAKETRTYRDRAEANIVAVAKRRRKIRDQSVEYKGGKCTFCNYAKYVGALDFHHLDPTAKEFGLSASGLTRSWSKTKRELDKCILVCANCHRKIHAGLIDLSSLSGYNNPVR